MAGLELKAPPTAEVASLPLPSAKGHGDKKHSIDMGAQHSLEWNVTSFQVGMGKSKKSILNLVGTCVCGLSVWGWGREVCLALALQRSMYLSPSAQTRSCD